MIYLQNYFTDRVLFCLAFASNQVFAESSHVTRQYTSQLPNINWRFHTIFLTFYF